VSVFCVFRAVLRIAGPNWSRWSVSIARENFIFNMKSRYLPYLHTHTAQRLSVVGWIALGCSLLLPWRAHAAIPPTTAWAGSSGNWSDASNWTNGVPSSATISFINNGGTATATGGLVQNASSVFIGGDLVASALMIIDGGKISVGWASIGSMGTVTVSGVGSTWSSLRDLEVQAFDGSAQLFIMDGGTVSSRNAHVEGTASTVTVTGAGSNWANSGNLIIGSNSRLVIEEGGVVGNARGFIEAVEGVVAEVTVSGAGSAWTNTRSLNVNGGTLTIAEGGVVTSASLEYDEWFSTIGAGLSSVGTVQVTGDGSSWFNSGVLRVGGIGAGALVVEDRGTVSTSSLDIGYYGDEQGAVTVRGMESILTVDGDLTVGYRGTGALVITDGATVNNSTGTIGAKAGSAGTVEVTGEASAWTNSNSLYIGRGGAGALTILGGGSVSNEFYASIGDDLGSAGSVTVSGARSTWTNSGNLNVGVKGTGMLVITEGGVVRNSSATISYGVGSEGAVTVSGAGSTWMNSGALNIGQNGAGIMTVVDGGRVDSNVGFIGSNDGITGVVTVSGEGSSWMNTGGLYVGFSGLGSLVITDGGTVSDAAGYVGSNESSVGAVTVSGAGSTWTNADYLSVGHNGTGTLTIAEGGTVSAGGGIGILELARYYPGGSTGTLNIGEYALDHATTGGTLGVTAVVSGEGAVINFNQTDEITFSSSISGEGRVVQRGIGTTILTGVNTYTGATTVSGGTLVIDGSLTSDVAVNDGGTLRGSGTISADVAILSGGSLASGSSGTPGILRIDGSLTLESGSTTSLRVLSASSYDSIRASTLTIGPDTTLNLLLGAGLLDGDTFALLKATHSFSGTFETTHVTNNLDNALRFILRPVIRDGGELDLIITTVQTSFVPFAVTPNQQAISRTLDSLVNDARADGLLTALNGLMGTELPVAFELLTPSQQTLVPQLTFAQSRGVFVTLQQRLGDVRAGSTGLSFAQIGLNLPLDTLLAGTTIPRGAKPFIPAPDNRWGFFLSVRGAFGETDGQTASTSKNGGFLAGADYRLSDQFAVGLAAGYDHTRTGFNHSDSQITTDSMRLVSYSTWTNHRGDWVDANIGGAFHTYDSKREALGGSALSSTRGAEWDAALTYGHDFKARAWTLTPFIGLSYLHLNVDDYTESGSLAPLSVESQSTHSLRSTLGGTAAYSVRWKGVTCRPYLQAGWSHELGDSEGAVSARFASGAGDLFVIQGGAISRDSLTFGSGVQAQLSRGLSLHLAYAGETNGQFRYDSLSGSCRLTF
jgi:T5SS/PEP-CTERM-associated repeat protein/autotransporter-associated beta strand protein